MKSNCRGLNPSRDSKGNRLKSYEQWQGMRKRCSASYQRRFPTYIGCIFYYEWENYDKWLSWAKSQVGFGQFDEQGLIYQLDKDFLFEGNKIYSPETCVFIPAKINSFILTNPKFRGEYPLGVQYVPRLKKFTSSIKLGARKQKYLGLFESIEEAYQAYSLAKKEYATFLATKYEGLVDPRVISRLKNFNLTGAIPYEVIT